MDKRFIYNGYNLFQGYSIKYDFVTTCNINMIFTHADDSLGVGRAFGCVCVYVCVCLSVCFVEKKPLEVLTSNLTSC